MAKAIKCDRCKKCFDPLDHGLRLTAMFQNPILQSSEDIKKGKVGSYLVEDSAEAWVDLCPDCTESFVLFMEQYPLAIEYESFDKADTDETDETKAAMYINGTDTNNNPTIGNQIDAVCDKLKKNYYKLWDILYGIGLDLDDDTKGTDDDA